MKHYPFILVWLFLAFVAWADFQYPVGESATYKILWGVMNCGSSTISCDLVEVDGDKFIRIRTLAKSNWLVSSVYPVNDIVDCFIDPSTGHSVRVEKETSEGDKICRDTLHINRENNTVEWTSLSDNISTNYPIVPGACDAVSFVYSFRRHDFEPGESKAFNIIVDTALQGISVKAVDRKPKKTSIGDGEKVMCREYVVTPQRDGLFVRKVPKSIWLTNDEHRIMTRMDMTTPVGRVKIILEDYTPPN
jgi:hypothetical protein